MKTNNKIKLKQLTINNQPVIQIHDNEYFIPDYFISINPHKINSNDNLLLKTYKDSVMKFYKKVLGNNFYKKTSRQYKQMFVIEFGKLQDIQKVPHLHILLQSKDENNVIDFVNFVMERLKKKYNPDIDVNDYQLQAIQPKDYEVKLGYMLKEEHSKLYTHLDLMNNTELLITKESNVIHQHKNIKPKEEETRN